MMQGKASSYLLEREADTSGMPSGHSPGGRVDTCEWLFCAKAFSVRKGPEDSKTEMMLDQTLNHLDGDRRWPGPWWDSTFGVLMGLISSGLRGLGVGKKQLPGGKLEYADCEEGSRGDGGTRQRE